MRLICLSILVLTANAHSLKIRGDDPPTKIEELKHVKDTASIPKYIKLENPDEIKPSEEEKEKHIEEGIKTDSKE